MFFKSVCKRGKKCEKIIAGKTFREGTSVTSKGILNGVAKKV